MPTNPGGTRERIIDVAGNLFYHHGFQAVGLDQILDGVGISKTALYKHFESKDDIILAVLETRDRRDIADAIDFMRTHGSNDPRRQVVALFDQLEEWFSQDGFRGCLFMNAATEFPSPHDPINQAAQKHGRHLAQQIHQRLVEAGIDDPDALTQQCMVLLTGAIVSRHTQRITSAAASAKRAVEVILGVESISA
ncbi:MAG: TetR/AcrR family transcriptional regulator [Phycisphaerales bacterium]